MRILVGSQKVTISRPLGALIRKQVLERLQRFGAAIVAAEVRLTDRNGRRGGADKRCRIAVTMAGGGLVVCEDVRANPKIAVMHALSRIENAIQKQLRSLADAAAPH